MKVSTSSMVVHELRLLRLFHLFVSVSKTRDDVSVSHAFVVRPVVDSVAESL